MATQAGSVFVTVGAKISEFDSGMKRVQDRMTRFQRDARSATSSAGSFRTGVGKLGAALTALAYGGMSAVGRGLQAMALGIRVARAAFGALIGATVGGVGLGFALKYAVGMASSLNEEMNKTRVVFGRSAKGIIQWSRGTAQSLGISRVEALKTAGTFGAMLRPLGIGQKPAARMSKTLVTLAADMASFNNTSTTDALEALRAGLAGEMEPLRRYGVMLTEARLRQEAIASGLIPADFKGVLDPLTRSYAAYNLILKDTKLQQGDVARTQGSLANQTRIAKASVLDLVTAFGQGLLPVAKEAVTQLNTKLAQPGTIQGVRELGKLVGEKLLTAFRGISKWLQENWGGIKEGFSTARDILVGAAKAANRLAGALQRIAEITPGSGVMDLVSILGTMFLGKKAAGALVKRAVKGGGGGGAARGLVKGGAKVAGGAAIGGAGLAVGVGTAAAAAVITAGGAGYRTGAYDAARYPYIAAMLAKIQGGGSLTAAEVAAVRRVGGKKSVMQMTEPELRRLNSALKRASMGIGRRPEEGSRGPAAWSGGVGTSPTPWAGGRGSRPGGWKPARAPKPPGGYKPERPGLTGGTTGRGTETGKPTPDEGPLIPFGFQQAVARADLTKKISDDLKAYSQLEAYLTKRLQSEKNVERRIDLLQALKDTREKKAALLKPAEKADAASIVGQLFGGQFLSSDQFQYAQQFGYKATGADLVKDLRSQVQAYKMFEQNLATLRKKGAPEAMIQELRGMGVGSAEQVSALAKSGKGLVGQYATLYGQREQLAQSSVAGDQINIGPFYVNSKSEEEGVRRAMRRAKFALAGAGAGRKGGR